MKKGITIKKSLKIKGKRQSDGVKTWIKFIPCDDGLFIRYRETTVPIDVDVVNFKEKRHTTSITVGDKIIDTVEHVLSAVNGLEINNLIIEFGSDQPPFFSDSKYITTKLKKNLRYLGNNRNRSLILDKEIIINGDEGRICKITPCDNFILDVTIDFNNIIGKQRYIYDNLESDYLDEISFARSFLINEITDVNNPWNDNKIHEETFPSLCPKKPEKSPFITFTKDEYLVPLRDPLEFVKHKMLDFIGDIIFLGELPSARFEIYKPGHAFNREIVTILNDSRKVEFASFDYFLRKIPEFISLEEYIENNIVHKQSSVFDHTKKVFLNTQNILEAKNIPLSERQEFRLRLAVFLHDFGKKNTLKINGNTTSCKGHEISSVEDIIGGKFLDRFTLEEEDKKWVLSFIEKHSEMHCLFDYEDKLLNKKFKSYKKHNVDSYLENLIFSISDIKDTYFKENNNTEYNRRINFLDKKIDSNL